MKRSMFMLLLLLPFLSMGQFHMGGGTGWDTWGKGKVIMVGNVGYQFFERLNVDFEWRPSVPFRANVNNYIGGKMGINLFTYSEWSLIPAFAYYYNYSSADKRYLNTAQTGYLFKVLKYIAGDGSVFAETGYMRKAFQFTIGMQFSPGPK